LASKVDGPGLAKLETLDRAFKDIQRLNTVIERMAQAQRMNQPLAAFRQQIHRAATPVASLLKIQFGPIADMITNLVLVSTRGGNDQQKVRLLRESLAQIKVHLEMADAKVKKDHALEDKEKEADSSAH
jgi:hypothetical protein